MSVALVSPSEPLLAQIRAATAPLHRDLDSALRLGEGEITRQKYVNFLRGSLTALQPLDRALRPWSQDETRSRCDALRADLTHLGASTSVAELSEQPIIGSHAAAFGALYVVEGSALGGAILSRSFDAALGLNGQASSYLTLYGDGLGDHWRGFLSKLDQFGQVATSEMRAEACDAARAVFNLYAAGFRSVGAIAAKP